jgi:hypothetical protein
MERLLQDLLVDNRVRGKSPKARYSAIQDGTGTECRVQ